MNMEQALEVVARAVAQYRGTLEEHQMLQEALKVIQEAVEPTALKPAKTVKSSKS